MIQFHELNNFLWPNSSLSVPLNLLIVLWSVVAIHWSTVTCDSITAPAFIHFTWLKWPLLKRQGPTGGGRWRSEISTRCIKTMKYVRNPALHKVLSTYCISSVTHCVCLFSAYMADMVYDLLSIVLDPLPSFLEQRYPSDHQPVSISSSRSMAPGHLAALLWVAVGFWPLHSHIHS